MVLTFSAGCRKRPYAIHDHGIGYDVSRRYYCTTCRRATEERRARGGTEENTEAIHTSGANAISISDKPGGGERLGVALNLSTHSDWPTLGVGRLVCTTAVADMEEKV